jgi:hypothetical protein
MLGGTVPNWEAFVLSKQKPTYVLFMQQVVKGEELGYLNIPITYAITSSLVLVACTLLLLFLG